MNIGKSFCAAMFVAAALAASRGGLAEELAAAPAPSGATLWNFLGIPQGIYKVRDATVNKHGNRPQRERKPPLKRIADPANLESQNPAIKTAAKIKAEEDLAPQKIKAIKYLATVGCGCYPGVRDALLAALDDCTEAVRYEAAIAFCQAAGDPCNDCDRSGCCSAAVMARLYELAHGQDEEGCWKEASARVRATAENALNACRRRTAPTQAPSLRPLPEQKEVPIEAPLPAPKTEAITSPASAPTASESAGTSLEYAYSVSVRIIPASAVRE